MKAILQHTVHLCSTAPSESVNPSKKDHTMQVSAIRAMKNFGQACVSVSCKVTLLSSHVTLNEEKGEIVSDLAMSMAVCHAGAR